MLAIDERRLLVAEENVRAQGRRIVAKRGVSDSQRTGAVEIHATVKFEQDVFRGAIGAGENGNRTAFDHRHGRAVGEVGRCGVRGIATIRQAVGVEVLVAVAAVLAGHRNSWHFLVVLIKRDGW